MVVEDMQVGRNITRRVAGEKQLHEFLGNFSDIICIEEFVLQVAVDGDPSRPCLANDYKYMN